MSEQHKTKNRNVILDNQFLKGVNDYDVNNDNDDDVNNHNDGGGEWW